MHTKTTLSTIAALGLLSLGTSALAQAAPAKLAAGPTAGGVTIKVTNPNRYAVSGTVALVSGKKTIEAKRATVAAKHSKTVSLSGHGLRSATLVTKLGRRGSKPVVKRRAVTFGGIVADGGGLSPSSTTVPAPGRASVPAAGTPSGGSTPPPGNGNGGGANGGGANGGNDNEGGGNSGGGNPPPPPNTHWTATDLTNGGEFGLEVKNGMVSLDGSYLMPVFCQESGGQYRWAWSHEVIDEYQNWALGNQYGTRYRDIPRVNLYAGTSDHRVTYKITSQQNGNQITGTISQSFAAPRWENNHSVLFDCSGSLSYSATQ